MSTPTPLWQRLTAAGAPRHVVAQQIQTVWDWLDETFSESLSNEVYNAIILEAIEAASWGDEPEPAPEPESESSP
jgi:hypothetical protein